MAAVICKAGNTSFEEAYSLYHATIFGNQFESIQEISLNRAAPSNFPDRHIDTAFRTTVKFHHSLNGIFKVKLESRF